MKTYGIVPVLAKALWLEHHLDLLEGCQSLKQLEKAAISASGGGVFYQRLSNRENVGI